MLVVIIIYERLITNHPYKLSSWFSTPFLRGAAMFVTFLSTAGTQESIRVGSDPIPSHQLTVTSLIFYTLACLTPNVFVCTVHL